MEKQRQMLLRRHRNVIYLNDSEAAAITEYCQRFGVRSRSALMREAIMNKVLTELGTNPPTLF